MDLNIKPLPNGDLLLTCGNETRQELRQAWRDSDRDYYSILAELFEPYSCNGSYTHFDAGQANPFVGLTSAPCIAESMDYPDNGDCVLVGKFWHHADYMITNDLDLLIDKGRAVYSLAR